ncbi:MAG: TatD family hydrolase [Bacillota bacterium]|uniref:TatD family hydrolase n=1 Tax=Virgibacillus salarius TaxID=447199 RepID=A0A941DUH7_9BACI|nr:MULTISPECIES: TatD family hydrolase [Bacillaceae]NAZ08678.1 TatD family deoxyribonuclease [Agaribacter marinus]MBR7795966.1 TatD family hydrolase [Virgibacillus salarius]MCC2248745.1 TatD family hydrolase [Virgibacillus sp. AGTR]MDY7043961.1 TatD family hydrolase [Virgibacillus sp. M23]QRZ17964.1 TatD family hydrolase [Virgibacillus sp. AGTR]
MDSFIIDAHIHLDMYTQEEQTEIIKSLKRHHVSSLISVSNNLASSISNLRLAERCSAVKPAFGFHPEQEIPNDNDIADLIQFIDSNLDRAIAVGEVGLPYYKRQENSNLMVKPYIELLELFIRKAKEWNKPIVLHAVYDDATIACDLLEKYSITNAQFHWFKGDKPTMERMSQNGYFISITPDVMYEREINQLVNKYPITHMMVETDGPWQFAGPFINQLTHPKMIHKSIKQIATIKKMPLPDVQEQLYVNTSQFFHLKNDK